MPKQLTVVEVVIAEGESLSGAADLGTDNLVGFIAPDDWSASLGTLQGSVDGVEFFDAYDGVNEVTFNIVPNTIHAIDPDRLLCARYVKLRSGTANAPTPQEGERRVRLITSPSGTTSVNRQPRRKAARRHR